MSFFVPSPIIQSLIFKKILFFVNLKKKNEKNEDLEFRHFLTHLSLIFLLNRSSNLSKVPVSSSLFSLATLLVSSRFFWNWLSMLFEDLEKYVNAMLAIKINIMIISGVSNIIVNYYIFSYLVELNFSFLISNWKNIKKSPARL